MSLNDEIREYLLNNPNLLRSKYADTAKKFGTNYEQIRTIARRIRKNNPDTAPKEKEVLDICFVNTLDIIYCFAIILIKASSPKTSFQL